ncbi:MAG: DUF4079 family protein [Myxococcota bacterium]
MAFVHPAIGVLTILLSFWIMSRGLVARQGVKQSTRARRFHKKWAPWAFAAMVLSGTTGLASTVLLRPDLSVGQTWHLWIGIVSISTMGAAGLLTRAFTRNDRLRTVHPWIGVGSVVLAVLQGIVGIELLP